MITGFANEFYEWLVKIENFWRNTLQGTKNDYPFSAKINLYLHCVLRCEHTTAVGKNRLFRHCQQGQFILIWHYDFTRTPDPDIAMSYSPFVLACASRRKTHYTLACKLPLVTDNPTFGSSPKHIKSVLREHWRTFIENDMFSKLVRRSALCEIIQQKQISLLQ